MPEEIQGWTQFAKQVIQMLAEYDRDNKTYYSYYLLQNGGSPNSIGVRVLAQIMREVDKQNQWEHIPGGYSA